MTQTAQQDWDEDGRGVDVRPYETRAMDVLGIEGPDPKKEAFRWWRRDRWEPEANRDPKVGSSFEQVNGLMTGMAKYPQKGRHFEVLHRMLGLHLYGLEVGDLWERKSKSELMLSLDEFEARIRAALHAHADPLRLLTEGLGLTPDAALSLPFAVAAFEPGARSPAMACLGDAEGTPPQEEKPTVPLPLGDEMELVVQAREIGRVLLLSANTETGRYAVLNELMGRDRNEVFHAGEIVRFPNEERGREINGLPGPRTFVAVNWPEGLDPAPWSLDAIFERKAADATQMAFLTEESFRRIGRAVYDGAREAKDRSNSRIAASVQKVQIVERAST